MKTVAQQKKRKIILDRTKSPKERRWCSARISLPRHHPGRDSGGHGAMCTVQVNSRRQCTCVSRAPAGDQPGRGHAPPRKPPPRPGGFGFQRARSGNVAGKTMTIPVYGGNQGNGIGHAAAVHTRNSHRARTHMSDTLMSVYKRTHAHTRVRTPPPPSCGNIIIIVVIILDDDDNNIKSRVNLARSTDENLF